MLALKSELLRNDDFIKIRMIIQSIQYETFKAFPKLESNEIGLKFDGMLLSLSFLCRGIILAILSSRISSKFSIDVSGYIHIQDSKSKMCCIYEKIIKDFFFIFFDFF